MLEIDPLTAPPDVDLVVPGSKSLTNRALLVAALADGVSTLRGALFAEDTLAMVGCLVGLGATIEADAGGATFTVTGVGGRPTATTDVLWARQSGTTGRFVLPLAAMAGSVTVDGDPQLRGRPQLDLLGALEQLGATPTALGEPASLPIRFDTPALRGGLVSVAGDTSSQFVSALLLAGPVLDQPLEIELTGEPVSAPYLSMTVAVMRAFGARVDTEPGRYVVHPGGYQANDHQIEPDASTASYFFAAAAVSGGRVKVDGLGSDSTQGDAAFAELLGDMGAIVRRTPSSTEVQGTGTFEGVETSMEDFSDTAPTLGAVAPLATGPVRVTGVGFIRNKESDRIAAVVDGLTTLGVDARAEDDGFIVQPGSVSPGLVATHDDHRIAMAFTILGLNTPGVSIDDPTCVAKTFPSFFDAVDELRLAGDAALRILALDGPAGSGKSTVAKLVADRLGLDYLDTGAMYRSVAHAALRDRVSIDDGDALAALARHTEIDVGRDRVLVDGEDATSSIRSAAVNAAVSRVATNSAVRSALRRQQRAWARRRGGGVLEGRDIGSVVFPRARLKVFVTATPEERARRRSAESGRSYDEILAEVTGRDEIDSNRADSPLVEASDAVMLDTTGLSIDQVVTELASRFTSEGQS